MRLKKITFIFLLFLIGCNNKPTTTEIDTLKIEIKEKGVIDVLNTDSIFESVTYLPLDSLENKVIGEVTRIQVFDNLIYIQEKQSEILYVYDFNGKYIRKLDKKGKSGSEYIYLDDFCIDGNNLYILCSGTRSIYIYNKTDFSFIEKIKLDCNYSRLFFTDDNILLYGDFQSLDGYNLFVFNRKTKEIDHRFKEFPKAKMGTGSVRDPFFYDGKELYFTLPRDYCVSKIENNECMTILNIDFGKDHMWNEDLFNAPFDDQYKYKRSIKAEDWPIEEFDNFIVRDSTYIFSFVSRTLINTCVYDLKTKTYKYGMVFGTNKFPLLHSELENYYKDQDNDYIIKTTDAYELCHLIERNKAEINFPDVLTKVKPNDNLILSIYKFK